MLIAHLSDLHVKEAGDVRRLERQLDCITGRHPDHLVITGDLLDRWAPPLLSRILDALAERDLLTAARTTVLHGNHDLASSGGHPSRRADLWRLALRFWDPPPLLGTRQRRFHQAIAARAEGVAGGAPYLKRLPSGLRLAVLDSVPAPWTPFALDRRRVVLNQAIGAVPAAQCAWLEARPREATPLVVLMHHYPLDIAPFQWIPGRPMPAVIVPMHIRDADRHRFWRAASAAGVLLVVCGHVHRTRLDWHEGIAVGLNGAAGAEWAGSPVGWYRIDGARVDMETEATGGSRTVPSPVRTER